MDPNGPPVVEAPKPPTQRKEWRKEVKDKSPARDMVKQKMKELDSDLRDDLSDISDNAP